MIFRFKGLHGYEDRKKGERGEVQRGKSMGKKINFGDGIEQDSVLLCRSRGGAFVMGDSSIWLVRCQYDE